MKKSSSKEISLYNIDEIKPELNKSLIKLTIKINGKTQIFNVSFSHLSNISPYIKEKYTNDNFANKFSDRFQKNQKQFNILEENCNLFLTLISGKSIKLTFGNSFDIFKLSSFYKISSLSKEILSYWQIDENTIDEMKNCLSKFDKSIENDDQREFFEEFITKSEIPQQFFDFISFFLNDNYSTEFISLMLSNCGHSSIEQDSQDKLLEYILMDSSDERLALLSFLNINNISKSKRDRFLYFIFDQYCQLLQTNAFYIIKNKSDINECLIDLSKKGNLIASYDLYHHFKNDQNKQKQAEQYRKAYKNQKKLINIYINLNDVLKQQAQEPNSKLTTKNVNKMKNDPNDPNITDSTHKSINKITSQQQNEVKNDDDNYKSDDDTSDDNDELDDDYDEEYDMENNPNNNSPSSIPSSHTNINNTFLPRKKKSPGSYHHKRRPVFTAEEIANQKIWRENEEIIKKGFYYDDCKIKQDIKAKVEDSNKNTQTIKKDYNFKKEFTNKIKKNWGDKEKKVIESRIKVTKDSTYKAAFNLKMEKIKEVCVLNFASATKPGGGVKNGRKAQEETLSRMSSLYFSISQQKEMYEVHKKLNDPLYTDYMIYSPNVVVFRDDSYKLIMPYRVSVITSAAVNYKELAKTTFPKGSRDQEVLKIMKDRCRKILQLAILNNNRAIVLGAFGCGVFGNKPEDISKIFRQLLVDEFYGYFFDKIIFAIKIIPGQKNVNYDAFKATFNHGYK